MTSRSVSGLLLLVFLIPPAAEAEEEEAARWARLKPVFTVPEEWKGDFGSYRSPLRFQDGTQVRTPEEWQRRRAEILEEWTERMGQWPPLQTRPQVEVMETVSREDGITQQRIRFLWTPEGWTEAILLVPEGNGPMPGVVTVYYEPETAAGLGKAHRDFALQLAREGLVALSIGTTEATAEKTYSLYYPDIDDASVEPLSMLAYAAASAWHVLAAREDVDADRIGIVGHSFGGKWAMFAACLFEPFACVAVSDPGIVFDDLPGVNYWEPWYLGWHPRPWRSRGLITEDNPARGLYPRLVDEGRDLHELHALLAPRPFLVSGGAVDPPSRWQALNHLVEVNRVLGYEHRVGMTNRPDHAPDVESNAVIVDFFRHFLGTGSE